MDCIFCKIIQGQAPANVIYEDAEIMAFDSIEAQAPTHILLIPKKHIATINDASDEDGAILGRLTLKASELAIAQYGDDTGYRLVFNVNQQGGQTVYHVHLHLLSGRQMLWPPG